MLLRNRKKNDVNHGKWIGVGGKCEAAETFEACAKREVNEETGLLVHSLTPCGIVSFVYDHQEPETIAVYVCDDFTGELQECDEGTLAWIREDRILDLELWEGDRVFLKKMLAREREPFHLELHYDEAGNLIQVLEITGENL